MNYNLMKIQSELKAPKGNYNRFGNYKYRSCEDILESLKPLLLKYNCTLTISDEIIFVEGSGRVYVKAVAVFVDNETNETVTVQAFAREPSEQKGMSDSQITGTASSYARKYALNGMFLIDDTKDADTDEYRQESDGRAVENQRITKQKAAALLARCEKDGVNIQRLLAWCKVTAAEDITERQYSNINVRWEEVVKAYGDNRQN